MESMDVGQYLSDRLNNPLGSLGISSSSSSSNGFSLQPGETLKGKIVKIFKEVIENSSSDPNRDLQLEECADRYLSTRINRTISNREAKDRIFQDMQALQQQVEESGKKFILNYQTFTVYFPRLPRMEQWAQSIPHTSLNLLPSLIAKQSPFTSSSSQLALPFQPIPAGSVRLSPPHYTFAPFLTPMTRTDVYNIQTLWKIERDEVNRHIEDLKESISFFISEPRERETYAANIIGWLLKKHSTSQEDYLHYVKLQKNYFKKVEETGNTRGADTQFMVSIECAPTRGQNSFSIPLKAPSAPATSQVKGIAVGIHPRSIGQQGVSFPQPIFQPFGSVLAKAATTASASLSTLASNGSSSSEVEQLKHRVKNLEDNNQKLEQEVRELRQQMQVFIQSFPASTSSSSQLTPSQEGAEVEYLRSASRTPNVLDTLRLGAIKTEDEEREGVATTTTTTSSFKETNSIEPLSIEAPSSKRRRKK